MQINFKQCNSANFNQRSSRDIEYIVIHYTGNKGDTAKNNADYFARQNVGASAHYFVDSKEIWQSVHDADIAWHCGAKNYKHKYCRNANSLGIEICMLDSKGGIIQASINKAAELTKYLMQKYGISKDNVIRHFDVTGKDCPAPMVEDESLWTGFKNKLCEVEQMKVYKYVPEMPDWAQDTFTRLFKAGIAKADSTGALSVQESSLQPMVYLDRLTGGQIEKLPEFIRILPELEKMLGK